MDIKTITKKLKALDLEVVMGLETHVRLNTATKLFCSCPNSEADIPNTHICPICTGQMGILPIVNREAVKKAILFGKAVHSSFRNKIICWDRKHYEYPDLPKNYQLTQFQKPVIPDGFVQCYRNDGSVFSVQLEQAHIEEDAAKLVHESTQTLVDFNKSGVPLIEVVTKPCINEIADVPIYAQTLQRIVQSLSISEANLEKGEFKSDVSVSLRKIGDMTLNPRAEIKNLNSFKFMLEAVIDEVEKQLDYYVKQKSFRPDQTTVLFDSDTKRTKTMRKKEFAADYRFALDPDNPLVNIEQTVESTVVDDQTLPFAIETILIKSGIRPQDAKFFTSDSMRSSLFMAINAGLNAPLFVAKTLLNNIKSEEYEAIENIDAVCFIFEALKAQRISVLALQEAITELIKSKSFDYKSFIESKSVSDEDINKKIDEVLLQYQSITKEIEAGNMSGINILVGSTIQLTGKSVSGKIIKQKIIEKLSIKQPSASSVIKKSNESEVKTIQTKVIDSDVVIVKEQYRTHIISEISIINLNEEVVLAGWVASVRDHGKLIFIDLRDSSQETFQVRITRNNTDNFDDIAKLPNESVIMVSGRIVKRNLEDYNTKIRTGEIEIDTKQIEILNLSQPLPFEIRKSNKITEAVRLRYKFLDHRNPSMHKTIVNRHRVLHLIREILNNNNFIEIETPILSAGTDEGAREFIVPSRKFPGKFYSLPQSPQQYKQMLMVSGFERYFQLARCFRDEDSRGDRQAEFTQLDMEMSFVSMQDVITLNTNLFNEIVTQIYPKNWKLYPFRILTYKDAMDKYGSDRPDLRFALEMADITDIVKKTSFNVFAKPIENGGIVKCIKVSGKLSDKRITKSQVEKLTEIARQNGLEGLAYIIVKEDELQSPIIKYLGEQICQEIIDVTESIVGDIIFFAASDYKTANNTLNAVRQELGKILNLIKPGELHPAWVVDFPQYEKTEEDTWTFSHNPFSMPKNECLQDHLNGINLENVIAQQYDLILNGYEIGGGSIRAHKRDILEATYHNMGYDWQSMQKSIGHMLDAFQYGAPPHGGIAWGIDRLIMILEEKSSIREVIAFPKTGQGEEILFGSPTTISDRKVTEANIKIIAKQ
ncbi:MAG: bifunctional amidotransferase subunit GatB/aspartate--tRNA ligase AspS [Tannerella sp.]|jgi:aspartyl-tRNA synthetase|nr:bifunctional amidotransferase subunit GatB/aspartate--tRNA ligase AspS [Tannerella sp.]